MELKRSFSCPSPSGQPQTESESPLLATPPHHFKVPHHPSSRSRRTPKQRKPRPHNSHPYHHSDQDYPGLPLSSKSPLFITSSPSANVSYAQATQYRAGKRSMSDRVCLSPIDHLPKRNALSDIHCTSPVSMQIHITGTPKDHLTEELMDMDVNENTPGSERSVILCVAVTSQFMLNFVFFLFVQSSKQGHAGGSETSLCSLEGKCSAQKVYVCVSWFTTGRILMGILFHRNERSSSVCELSQHQLGQRQKQIDYGKNTLGYQRYIQTLPK